MTYKYILHIPVISQIYFYLKSKFLHKHNINNNLDIIEEIDIETETKYRTFNGTNNDLLCPYIGSSGQPFGRNTFICKKNINNPPIKLVAETLLHRTQFKEEKLVNLLGGAWIQFMIHDWFDHEKDMTKTIKINEMEINPFRTNDSMFYNGQDHWWSGSQIYGINIEQSKKLYDNATGKMKLDKEYLNIDSKTEMEDVGISKNLWFGLSMMHYIFILEHNYLIDKLKELNPSWDSSKLYNHARLIITALICKIHTVEWTTSIIQNFNGVWNQNFLLYGFFGKTLKNKIPHISNSLNGKLSGTNEEPYNIFAHTEEFNTVYRMHSLIPDTITIKSLDKKQDITYNTIDTALYNSKIINTTHTKEDIIYSLCSQKAGKLCLNNFPKTLTNFNGLDLSQLDIYRTRECKIPRYNDIRRSLSLKPIKSFSDLTNNVEEIKKLNKVYNNDVELLDFLVGVHAEEKLPDFIFGETVYTIFIIQTTRRIESDRFLTTDFNEKVYTTFGYNYIFNTTFKEILIKHFPKLKNVLTNDNPFKPL